MITGIDHVVFKTTDVEGTVDWYRRHLGVEAERLEAWRAGDAPFVVLRLTDTVVIDLFEAERDGENVDHIALVTERPSFDRFVAEHTDLIEMGPAQLSGAQGQGDGVYFSDPNGNRVELRTYG